MAQTGSDVLMVEEMAVARTPAEEYEARAAAYGARRDVEAARLTRAANLTVLLFFGGLALGLVALIASSWVILGLGLLALVWAVVLFVRQGRYQRRVERLANLAEMNREGLARLRRDWAALPLREPPSDAATSSATSSPLVSALAGDLDLTGHASLRHLLSSATMTVAQARLREWMFVPALLPVVRARQGAARDLAPRVAFREELGLGGRLMGRAQDSYPRFLIWAESGPILRLRRFSWLVWLSRISPALTLLLIVVQVVTRSPYPFWLPFLAINLLVAWGFGKVVDEQLDRVAEQQGAFAPYAELFRVIALQEFADPETRRVQAELATGPVRGDVAMERLDRLVRLSNLRLSMFYPVLQALTLWSFHTLWLLEGWQREAGAYARGWLEALGEMEALSALGTLAHDEPDWAFPTLLNAPAPGTARLTASGLGHPLLPDDRRVGNDVEIGPPGTFLLVTGSNMSGKSTLLRAVGVNVVLAQMGAPVCAAALALPPVRLATSIRVQDSLEQGISYFMAELHRLKLVVDTATEANAAVGEDDGRTVLYLLDEILHGTNTSERQIAARRIIRYLLRSGAIGAVSTHDLTLAEAPDLTAAATLVHFTERFTRDATGPHMSFDYRLRPGLATSANALKLMELVGMDIGEE